MSHHIYTTDAIILESSPGRDANKSYILLTEDLGKIRASAQSVRLSSSKLRFSLQDFSVSNISLVRGKEYWRITNAALKENVFQKYQKDTEAIQMIARIFGLLKRLVPEEEKNPELFFLILSGFDFLREIKTKPELAAFEQMLVLRLLRELGYLKDLPELRLFYGSEWNIELVHALEKKRSLAVGEINRSLRESQL